MAAVPKVVVPSLNTMLPVGVSPVVVAVNVTLWPTIAVVGFALSVLVVVTALIVMLLAVEVLVASLLSPA